MKLKDITIGKTYLLKNGKTFRPQHRTVIEPHSFGGELKGLSGLFLVTAKTFHFTSFVKEV